MGEEGKLGFAESQQAGSLASLSNIVFWGKTQQ
jgi:hypothetical protein